MQTANSIETRDRFRGVVKFFNSQKGYGFIIPLDVKHVNPNGRNEIFVHHSAIINEGGFKSLAENEQVEYGLAEGPKGIQAADVTGPGGAPVLGDPMINKIFLQNGFNSYGAFGHMGYPVPHGPLSPYYSTSMYPLHSMYAMQQPLTSTSQNGMLISPQFGSMTPDGYSIDSPVGNTLQSGHGAMGQGLFRYHSGFGQAYPSNTSIDQVQHSQNRSTKDDNNSSKLSMNSHTHTHNNIATPPSPLRSGNGGHTNSFSGNNIQTPAIPLPASGDSS